MENANLLAIMAFILILIKLASHATHHVPLVHHLMTRIVALVMQASIWNGLDFLANLPVELELMPIL